MTLRSSIKLVASVCALAAGSSTLLLAQATRTSLSVETGELSAQVTDALGRPISGGVVSFLVDAPALKASNSTAASPSLGSAVVDEQGRASLALPRFPAEARVVAVYAPAAANDSALEPSSSPLTLVAADATGVPDFTVTANPSSLSEVQGSYATTELTITPLNGFAESVTLSCSNLPGQAVCTFTPVIGSTAPTGTGTAAQPFTSNLQVSTQAASGSLVPADFGRPARTTSLALLLPGFLALAGIAAARKRPGWSSRTVVLVAAGALAASVGLAGCSQRYGYLKHPPPVAAGTPLGTYTINIAAAGNNGSSVTSHTINLTLAVTAAK